MKQPTEQERIGNLFGKKPQAPSVIDASLPTRPRLMLGSVPIPIEYETRHILAIGTTGSGKSQAIYTGMLSPIRERDESAIVVDHSSEYLQRYYRPGVDFIFNPFDKRSVGWSPFNEIRRKYDFIAVAGAIVPDVAGENQDWQLGARQLLANVLKGLWELGKENVFQNKGYKNPDKMFCTNEALVYFLTKAPLRDDKKDGGVNRDTLEYVVRNSTSRRLFEVGNEKQLAITLGILSRYLEPFTYLKDGDFSIVDYVKKFETVGRSGQWLFLSYTDASYEAIKSLFGIMVSCGIRSGLELSESRDRRFYFVLDEFSSLDKITGMDDAAAKFRKRGGVVIAGIQSTSQLVEKYGDSGSQTLMSCFNNVLMLRVADDETAEKLSKLVGDVEKFEESQSASSSHAADGTLSTTSGTSKQKTVKRGILGSEFMGLEDLHGFARVAGAKFAASIIATTVPISKLPLVAIAEDTCDDVYL